MAPKKNKKNKKQKDSESSTPQSSVPSVDDDEQKLLQRGACGSSYSHQSGKAVKSTTGAKSTAKRKNSESSTTQSTVLSVDDDEEKLPQGGACGSSYSHQSGKAVKSTTGAKSTAKRKNSESSTTQSSVLSADDDDEKLAQGGGSSSSHQSRSREKSTRVAKSTVSGKGSRNRSLSSRNAPESPPGKNRLTVPAQGSGTVGPNTSPKKSIFTQLTDRLSPKKRSPSPSTDSKCRCESKTNHKTDCPEWNKLEADAKRKSPQRPNESKASSSNLSAVISTNKVEGAQSSSSSGPCVKKCSNNSPQSEKLLEKSLLSIPEQAKVAVSPKGARKTNLLSQIKGKISPKKRSPNPSPLRCGCTNRNDHDLKCPESGKREENLSRSRAASISVSPTSKKKQSDASYTSSEISKLSKSSSTLGTNVKENTLDKKIPKNSGNKTASNESEAKYNTFGTPKDTAGHELHGIRIGIEKSLKMWFKSFKRHKLGKERIVDREPVIENLDDSLSEEFDQKLEIRKSRPRSKSFGTNVRVSRRRRLLERQSNVQPEDESDDDTQMGDSLAREKDADILRGDEIDVDTELGAVAVLSDSSVRIEDSKILQGDGINADSQRGAAATLSDSSVRPKDRKGGSNTDSPLGDGETSSDSSVRPKDRKVQQKDGDDTNIERRPGIRRPPFQIVEETTAVPSNRRHQSLSPYPRDPCLCGNRYMHEIGCSREIRARQRRNRKRCRQSGIDPKSNEQQEDGSKKS